MWWVFSAIIKMTRESDLYSTYVTRDSDSIWRTRDWDSNSDSTSRDSTNVCYKDLNEFYEDRVCGVLLAGTFNLYLGAILRQLLGSWCDF